MRTLRRKLIVGISALGLAVSIFGGPAPQAANATTCQSDLPAGDETCAVILTVLGTGCRAISKYCQLG